MKTYDYKDETKDVKGKVSFSLNNQFQLLGQSESQADLRHLKRHNSLFSVLIFCLS